MNEVEEIHGESAHIDGENSIVGIGGDDDDEEDRQYFIEFQREVSQYREMNIIVIVIVIVHSIYTMT